MRRLASCHSRLSLVYYHTIRMSACRIVLACCSYLAALGCAGCERRPEAPLDTRQAYYRSREYWISYFEKGLSDGSYVGRDAERIRSLTQDLHSSHGPLPPRLLVASWLLRHEDKQPYVLLLFYDEEECVVGFRVTEYAGDGSLATTEDYVLFPQGRTTGPCDSFLLPFETRSRDQAKDEDAWKRFALLSQRTRESLPPIWLSAPSDSRRVEITLIDSSGTEKGEALSLERTEERKTDAAEKVSGSFS